MALRIYDSKTHQVRDFEPLREGEVGLYLCGPTVQGAPHLGHLRAALNFDVLVRWLRRSGFAVTYVRNVTDIDDKILRKSQDQGIKWWALAAHYEQEFNWAYRVLNTVAPTVTPHATGHIPAQIDLISRLIQRGHAYADGAGNVYFAVASLPDYGSLTNQRLENLGTTEDPRSTTSPKRESAICGISRCGRRRSPANRRMPPGIRLGVEAGRAGIWNARR